MDIGLTENRGSDRYLLRIILPAVIAIMFFTSLPGSERIGSVAGNPGDTCAYDNSGLGSLFCDGVCETCSGGHGKYIYGGTNDPLCSTDLANCALTLDQYCSQAGGDLCSDWNGLGGGNYLCYDMGAARCLSSVDIAFGNTGAGVQQFTISTCTGGCNTGCSARGGTRTAGTSSCGVASCSYTNYNLGGSYSAQYLKIVINGALDITEVLINAQGNCGSCAATGVCDTTGCGAGTYCEGRGGACVTPDANETVCEAGCTGTGAGNHTYTGGPDNWEAGTTSSCCGNVAGEYYKSQLSNTACCNTVTDCVDTSGTCIASGSLSGNPASDYYCNAGTWVQCAGINACQVQGAYHCAGDGSIWTAGNGNGESCGTCRMCNGAGSCVNRPDGYNETACGTTACSADASCAGAATYTDYWELNSSNVASCSRLCSSGACAACTCGSGSQTCAVGLSCTNPTNNCNGGNVEKCHRTNTGNWYWDTTPLAGETACGDTYDNDCDGVTDCGDLDCTADALCPEICNNGIDDDADTYIDCADAECTQGMACSGGFCCGAGCSSDGGTCSCAVVAGATCVDGSCNTYGENCCTNNLNRTLTCSGIALACQGGTGTCEATTCGASAQCDSVTPNSCGDAVGDCAGANGCTYTSCGTTSCASDNCTGVPTYNDYPVAGSATVGTCNNPCSAGACGTCATRSGTCGPSMGTCDSSAECDSAASNCAGGSVEKCHLNFTTATWLWDTAFAAESGATGCNDGFDNDCDGEWDYDTMDRGPVGNIPSHGDSGCPLSVSAISVSNATPCPGAAIQVNCTVSVYDINSVDAKINGSICTFNSWNMATTTALFTCTVPSIPGTYTANCSIDTAKSYKTGTDKEVQVVAGGTGCCSAYPTIGACGLDPTNCEWCLQCIGYNWTGGNNRCVALGDCNKLSHCWILDGNPCGAGCDGTNGGCGEGSSCNSTCGCNLEFCNPDSWPTTACCDNTLGVPPIIDTDNSYDAFDLGSCNGDTCWNLTFPQPIVVGVYNKSCCQDDSGESYSRRLANSTNMDLGYVSNPADEACCNSPSQCVDDKGCYTTASAHDADGDGDTDACVNGEWNDCTSDSNCYYKAVCLNNNCVGEWFYLLPIVPIGFQNYDREFTGTRTVIANVGYFEAAERCRYINFDNPSSMPNRGNINWTPWESCTSQRYWLLSEGEGNKTVYIEVNYSSTYTTLNDTIYYNATGCGLDNTAPSGVVINDGDYTNNNDTLTISWTAATDPEQQQLGIPITYEYQIYENESGTVIRLDSGITADVSVISTAHAGNLSHGDIVYVNVTAENCAGKRTTTLSDGLVIDLNPPIAPTFNLNDLKPKFKNLSNPAEPWQDLDEVHWFNMREAYFNWTSTDDLSGIGAYSYILTSNAAENPDNVPEGRPGSFASETYKYLTNLKSNNLYFKVKARDRAGNWGPAASYNMHVDNTAPSRPYISSQTYDGPNHLIKYLWAPAFDFESGIANYTLNISNRTSSAVIFNVTLGPNDTGYNYSTLLSGEYNATIGAINHARIYRWSTQEDIQTDFEPPEIEAKPRGTIVTLQPIIAAWTNEQAICTYTIGTGEKSFVYSNTTYHEAMETVSSGITYPLVVTCTDMAGNSANTGIIQFTPAPTEVPESVNAPDAMQTYYDYYTAVRFNITNSGGAPLGEMEKSRMKVRLNGTDIYFSLVDQGGGNYTLYFSAPKAEGTSTLSIIEDDAYTKDIQLTVQKIVLNFVYNGTFTNTQQRTYLAYGETGGAYAGAASDSAIKKVSISADAINASSLVDDSLYIFITRGVSNAPMRENLIQSRQFGLRNNPSFGYDISDKYILRLILSYGDFDIVGEGNAIYDPGIYNLLIRESKSGAGVNEVIISKSQTGSQKSVVKVD